MHVYPSCGENLIMIVKCIRSTGKLISLLQFNNSQPQNEKVIREIIPRLQYKNDYQNVTYSDGLMSVDL